MTSKVHSGVGNRRYQLAQVEGVKEKITTRGEGPGCRLGEPRDNSVIVVDGELCRCVARVDCAATLTCGDRNTVKEGGRTPLPR